jgi:hypothetical protein
MNSVRAALAVELAPWMKVLVLGVTPAWLADTAVEIQSAPSKLPLPPIAPDAILLGAEHLEDLGTACLRKLPPRGRLFILRPQQAHPPAGWWSKTLVEGELCVWVREQQPPAPDWRKLRAELASLLSNGASLGTPTEALTLRLQHAAREREACTRPLARLLAHSASVGPDISESTGRTLEEVRDLCAHVRHQTLTLLDSLIERTASADTSTQARIEELVGAQVLRDRALRQD